MPIDFVVRTEKPILIDMDNFNIAVPEIYGKLYVDLNLMVKKEKYYITGESELKEAYFFVGTNEFKLIGHLQYSMKMFLYQKLTQIFSLKVQ